MSTPKIKHSLASKTNKNVPKLKCILAQPFRRYCPIVPEQEVLALKTLITSDMEARNATKSEYRKSFVHLGLQQCLRTINSGRYSCVLISTDVKPKFVSAQILQLVAVKEKSPKGFCVPKLEAITEELFGIKSLAMVITEDTSSAIRDWVEKLARRFPLPRHFLPPVKNSVIKVPSRKKSQEDEEMVDFGKIYVAASGKERAFQPKTVHRHAPMEVEDPDDAEEKAWSGDFISFSDSTGKSSENFSKQSYETDRSKMMDVFDSFTKEKEAKVHYIGLKVNKIQGNPNRVHKNKKNSKK